MPTEMQTVTTSSDYQVAPGDQLVFTNRPAFLLSQPIVAGMWASPSPHLRISGEVDVVMTSASAAGSSGMDGIVISNTVDSGPSVILDPGAVLKVTVSGGSAIGYFGGGTAGPVFVNDGAVIVSADGQAPGLLNWANSGVLINAGQVSVTSATSDATGLSTEGGGYRTQVLNYGDVTVLGHGHVTGVDMGPAGSGQVFHNTGSIVAQDDSPAQTSVGVYWGDGPQTGALGSFINDGTIRADRALDVEISYGAAADNLVTNNGQLVGEVWMGGGGAETLVNNGVIDGVVRMIGAASLYDGRLGTALGEILASNNGGDTLLGGAGAETLTGGLGNDTVAGGGGDDLIDGGEGQNQLDGGAGLNTLSFASLSRGVQVDVAAGVAHTANGSDSFTGFAQVFGSAWSDTISGGATGDYLRGEDGNDSILGGAGFDDINGNKGGDIIDGGSGAADWLVGGQGNDLITAHTADNILYGNLGADTLHGGAGGEILRGGQGDDSIVAGSGAEWLSGDRGNDTVWGGSGADTFHSFSGAGQDIGYGFDAGKGDHVQLDAGTPYTVAQQGADTVIDMGNGDVLVLKSVTLASLPAGWLFES